MISNNFDHVPAATRLPRELNRYEALLSLNDLRQIFKNRCRNDKRFYGSDTFSYIYLPIKKLLYGRKPSKDSVNQYENFQVMIYQVNGDAELKVPMDFESIFDARIYASFQLCGQELFYSPNGIQGKK